MQLIDGGHVVPAVPIAIVTLCCRGCWLLLSASVCLFGLNGSGVDKVGAGWRPGYQGTSRL